MIYGYLRIGREKKEGKAQQKSIEAYAAETSLVIDDFIEVQPYSKRSPNAKRIDQLLGRMTTGDTLVVTELSRLGRNMLEVLNLITALEREGIAVRFVKQPELSTDDENPLKSALMTIFGYVAETERAFTSTRTREGLAAVKAKGVKLGRPKGHRNKERALDPHRSEIMELLNYGVNLTAIRKIINQKLAKSLSYSSYKYFVDHDAELLHARHNYDKNSLFH